LLRTLLQLFTFIRRTSGRNPKPSNTGLQVRASSYIQPNQPTRCSNFSSLLLVQVRWRYVYRLTQLGTVYISFILATCFGPFLDHHQAYVSLYNCTFSLTLILLMWRIGWANSIPIYIQQDATLHSLFISGNFPTRFGWYFHPSSGAHKLHLQHLVFVTPLLLSAAIVEEVETVCTAL
jgi:hypothetical protein